MFKCLSELLKEEILHSQFCTTGSPNKNQGLYHLISCTFHVQTESSIRSNGTHAINKVFFLQKKAHVSSAVGCSFWRHC